ncbi:MAG: hypothetical protein KDK39_06545 [Leptospiraceae bacterium]|nr:hypothetical protein [Leptospiraceae bacterium]
MLHCNQHSTVSRLLPYIFYLLLSLLIIAVIPGRPEGLVIDAQHKFIQIKDLIHFNLQSIERYYPSNDLDPEQEYPLYRPPFEYRLNGKQYIAFPYLWSYLNVGPYLLFGFYGLFLMPLLGGLLALFFFTKITHVLFADPGVRCLAPWFYLLSTPLVFYSSAFYEATVASALLYGSIYLYWQGSSLWKVALSGVCLIVAAQLRPEVLIPGGLLVAGLWALQAKKFTNPKTWIWALSFCIAVAFFFYINYILTGEPIGLRIIDVRAHDFTLKDRLYRLFEYLIYEKWSLLVYFPAGYFTLRVFWNPRKTQAVKLFLAACWLFILAVPMIALNQAGIDFTPRYYFPVIPFLGVYVIDSIVFQQSRRLKRALLVIVFVWSAVFSYLNVVFQIVVSQQMSAMQQAIQPLPGKQANVFAGYGFQPLLSNSTDKPLIVAYNLSEFEKIMRKAMSQKISARVFIFHDKGQLFVPDRLDITKKYYLKDNAIFQQMQPHLFLDHKNEHYMVFRFDPDQAL